MKKSLLALAALVSSMAFVPAAHADDCDPDDGAAEFARCLAERKLRSLRTIVPPVARAPAAAVRGDCDPDDDDFKACMRAMRVPGMRQGIPSGQAVPSEARPKAKMRPSRDDSRVAADAKPETPARAPAAPEAASAKAGADVSDGPACTKFLPNLGKSVVIPCVE
jgi:hypothetical protein